MVAVRLKRLIGVFLTFKLAIGSGQVDLHLPADDAADRDPWRRACSGNLDWPRAKRRNKIVQFNLSFPAVGIILRIIL